VGEELKPSPLMEKGGTVEVSITVSGVMQVGSDELVDLQRADWQDVLKEMLDKGIPIKYEAREIYESSKPRKVKVKV